MEKMTAEEFINSIKVKQEEERLEDCRKSFYKWLYDGVDFARADLVAAIIQIKNALRGSDPNPDFDSDLDAWKEAAQNLPPEERPAVCDDLFFKLLDEYHAKYEEWLDQQNK